MCTFPQALTFLEACAISTDGRLLVAIACQFETFEERRVFQTAAEAMASRGVCVVARERLDLMRLLAVPSLKGLVCQVLWFWHRWPC